MRITYLANSIIPSRAANSIHVMKVLHALQENGYSVELFVPKHKAGIETGVLNIFDFYGVSPFPITFVPWKLFPGSKYLYSLLLALFLKMTGRKMVYSRDFYPARFCSFFGINVIYEFHAPPIPNKWIFGNKLTSNFYKSKSCLGIVVISKALKTLFEKEGIKEKVIVAHDGSDPVPKNLSSFQLNGSFNVGYIGHLYEGRGIELIVKMAEWNRNIDFHIVGGNKEDVVSWKERVELSNIHFHGFISPAQTHSFRNSCDVLVAPYQKSVHIWGGSTDTSAYMSPLKIFEYMAAGKAIISSDLPVLREVLNSNNAILVDPENVDEWNKAILMLFDDPDRRQNIAFQAQSDFYKLYTWKKRMKFIIETIFRENCDRKN